jgi:hypothetical protein
MNDMVCNKKKLPMNAQMIFIIVKISKKIKFFYQK